jgi:hypothetical protein
MWRGEQMNALAYYLQVHHIEPLQLALAAGVRYLTVWNALHSRPITSEHAAKIRVALHSLTGIAYAGIIFTIPEPAIEEQTTRPIGTFPKRYHLQKDM